jgi:hyperosmotically inducible periplasmic protein
MKINTTIRMLATVLAFSGLTMIACKSKPTDAEILTSVNEKIAASNNMKGLTASVTNGVVTLSGECPTEDCRTQSADQVKNIKGVKSVENNISVASAATPAPVEIASDETLQTSVNDVVKNYKGVKAEVKDGVITLRGEIKRDNLQDLIVSLNGLNPKKVENQLVIK